MSLFSSWRADDGDDWNTPEYKVNPIVYAFFWARSIYRTWKYNAQVYRYTLLCKMGYHITYDQVTVSSIGANGKRQYKAYRRPISHCRRCKQVVNKGIKTFFDDKKRLTSSSQEAQIGS